MQIFTHPNELRAWSRMRNPTDTLALVPTMGALHEGHLSLVRHARKAAQKVVVSVFVNPTQFGPHEDFQAYPRTLQRDLDMLAPLGVDAVFTPTQESLYGEGFSTFIDPGPLANTLCGASRPGHFKGVCTVVYLLLEACACDMAFFGEKDFQQLTVLKKMVRDLKIPVLIEGLPIVREQDGLAMSSRITYLNAEQRQQALVLQQALRTVQEAYAQGLRHTQDVLAHAHRLFQEHPSAVLDYLHIVNPHTLAYVEHVQQGDVCAVAAKIGSTRLIDNCVI
jgi:pantoate--beta-alanine ligase